MAKKISLPRIGSMSRSSLEHLPRPRSMQLALPRARSAISAVAAEAANEAQTAAVLDEAAAFLRDASVHPIAMEPIGEASTISSVNSDCLTSFMGNLSPPQFKSGFHEDFGCSSSCDGSSSSMLSGCTSPAIQEGSKGASEESPLPERPLPSPRAVLEAAVKRKRRRSSSKPTRNPQEDSHAVPTKAEADYDAPRSKPKVTTTQTGANKGEDFKPVIEIGQEMNEDENTVAAMEILENIYHPLQKKWACTECIVVACNDTADDDCLFDDEGHEVTASDFIVQGRPEGSPVNGEPRAEREVLGASYQKSESKATSSLSWKLKHAHRKKSSGAVVKHLNSFYRSKRTSSRLFLTKTAAAAVAAGERSMPEERKAGIIDVRDDMASTSSEKRRQPTIAGGEREEDTA